MIWAGRVRPRLEQRQVTSMQSAVRPNLAEIERRVCDIASDNLSIPRHEVLPSSRLIEDLHCDSLDLIELIMSLEDSFSVTISNDPPNSVYKAVFTRQPFRLSDLAELVYLQHGTGKPRRGGWRHGIVDSVASSSVPFSQLSGKWNPESLGKGGSLFESLIANDEKKMYRRRSDGMRCILLPSAEVEIGSSDLNSLPDEQPLHLAELDAFLIDAEPVSTTAYCRFLNSIKADEQCLTDWILLEPNDDRQLQMPIERIMAEWQPVAGVEHLPMILVSWYGANAYSLWANSGQWSEYRNQEGFLPSESQWEYAARGTRSQLFPWGNDSGSTEQMISGKHEHGVTYQTDSLPIAAVNECIGLSPFGLHHMAGNVWQWCLDWYDEDFYRVAESTRKNPVNRRETGVRSERGGSWVGPAHLCRSSYRRGRAPNARGRCLGFRCISRPDSLSKAK